MENWKKKATTLETIHRHFSLFISVRHSPSCTIAFLYFYLFPCPHFHSRKDQPNDWEQEWKKGTVESGGHDLKWQTNVPYICVPDTDADGYHLERLRSPPPCNEYDEYNPQYVHKRTRLVYHTQHQTTFLGNGGGALDTKMTPPMHPVWQSSHNDHHLHHQSQPSYIIVGVWKNKFEK